MFNIEFDNHLHLHICVIISIPGQSWHRGTKWTATTGCGFDPHSRKWNIYLNIRFFALSCQGKARRWVSQLNTQCLRSSAKSGAQNVLTLGSLCLFCCVQDIMWNWIINTYTSIHINKIKISVCYSKLMFLQVLIVIDTILKHKLN